MIDITLLMQILTPALPILQMVGNKATESAAQKAGGDLWEKVWKKLSPKVEADAAAKKAIEKAAKEPENADRLSALKMALQDLLEEHPDLAKELAELVKDVKPEPTIQVKIHSQGDHNQNVGVNYGQM